MLRETQSVSPSRPARCAHRRGDREPTDQPAPPPLQPRRHTRRQVLLRPARRRQRLAAAVDREEPVGQRGCTSARCRRARWPTSSSRRSRRRCRCAAARSRMGRGYQAPADAPVCSAAQLGVALCPCSGTADPTAYAAAVDAAASALIGRPSRRSSTGCATACATWPAHQRFEEAATTRDRLSTLLGAVRRHLLVEALRSAETCRGEPR